MYQEKFDNKNEFYMIGVRHGYGHMVVHSTPLIEGETFDMDNDEIYVKRNRKEIFRSLDRDNAKEVLVYCLKIGVPPDTFPDTSEEVYPMKVLLYHDDHYGVNYVYNATTPDDFKDAARKFVTKLVNNGDLYPPLIPTNYSGIESLEELEQMPKGMLKQKEQAEKDFEYFQKSKKEYAYDLKEWKNVTDVIEGNGNPILAVEILLDREIRWEIVEVN